MFSKLPTKTCSFNFGKGNQTRRKRDNRAVAADKRNVTYRFNKVNFSQSNICRKNEEGNGTFQTVSDLIDEAI